MEGNGVQGGGGKGWGWVILGQMTQSLWALVSSSAKWDDANIAEHYED